MYYFCSPMKASIKSIKPFQHVILTGSHSHSLAFSLLKAGIWWWGLGTMNLHILSACLFLNGNRDMTSPPLTLLSSWRQPKIQLHSHLTSCTGCCCPTHWVTAGFANGMLPLPVHPSPWCLIWKSHKERDIHIPIQFSSGTSVLIRMSSRAISPERPFPITPSNTI